MAADPVNVFANHNEYGDVVRKYKVWEVVGSELGLWLGFRSVLGVGI